jgi:restriction system protein
MSKSPSRSRQLGAKVIYSAMQVLQERGGELTGRDVIAEVEHRVELDDWARSTYEKSGYTRWISILHFYSIDMIKAGFMLKRKGVWYLTPEGEAAIKLGEHLMLETALAKYKEWRVENPREKRERSSDEDSDDIDVSRGEQGQEATLQEVEQRAADGIRQRIDSLNAYEFQDLVAALLRGMNYYTPFIAPRGKDGGVDIIAYQDPLGAVSPRIKVQIKHRDSSANVQEIRELIGLLGKDGDVGMFVSTGGFTSDARTQARNSHVHVELIDLNRFIALWQEFYPKLPDEDRERLRLRPVYFYDPSI